jgi:eukaryotic-like serine/threonine-protein kinase
VAADGGFAVFTEDPMAWTECAGTRIGPYKLLYQIGEGKYGVVFAAEQMEPVRRKVAVKMLKLDTRENIARFEAERQALALVDHPHIARIMDAGTTASGRPYFAMELINGLAITEYCDQNRLAVRERLVLFRQLCCAVQHAHQKGIIHRDLKPSDVLVTAHGGAPVVKLIDFGIAKAAGPWLTERTLLFAGPRPMIGTPPYMSPEQAGQGVDVDIRSDIYSLGVLLYELLTGTTPFDKTRFRQATPETIRAIIVKEEPPKPSTRLAELESQMPAASLDAMCAQRQTTAAKLIRHLRGQRNPLQCFTQQAASPLDGIVMKCLEKDRDRRYSDASALAADIQRHL